VTTAPGARLTLLYHRVTMYPAAAAADRDAIVMPTDCSTAWAHNVPGRQRQTVFVEAVGDTYNVTAAY